MLLRPPAYGEQRLVRFRVGRFGKQQVQCYYTGPAATNSRQCGGYQGAVQREILEPRQGFVINGHNGNALDTRLLFAPCGESRLRGDRTFQAAQAKLSRQRCLSPQLGKQYHGSMALPERVRVKLMSEAAEYISMTRVIERDFPMAELLEAVVAVSGKNPERLQQILRAGSMVLGQHRYRWEPLEADATDLAPLLACIPDPRPDRPFQVERCVYAAIHAGVETIELPREQVARRRWLQKNSFWEVLMEVARARAPCYQSYSYRTRADVYAFEPTQEDVERLRGAAVLLHTPRTKERIRTLPLEKVTLLVNR